MTQRQELEHHRRSLGEIRDIMNSMKTLAYLETRKLAEFLDAQQTVVASIEAMATDFLSFYPETLPEEDDAPRVYLLIGTERGFCGNLNQALVQHLRSDPAGNSSKHALTLGVGRKLRSLLENDPDVAALIDGASVAEEIPFVLDEIVRELSSLQNKHGVVSLHGIHHGGDHGIITRKLLPPFQQCLEQPRQHAHPPILNMPPSKFLIELTEQYVFAALHEMLYSSLMAENRGRVTHLEGAVQYLDEESARLAKKCNSMRQEEIIEEIEVILLSAASIEESWHDRR